MTVRVPDSGFDLTLALDGYAKDDTKKGEDEKPTESHGQVILAGFLEAGKKSQAITRIELTAERNDPPLTSEAKRDEAATKATSPHSTTESFDVGNISCFEERISMTIMPSKGASTNGAMVLFHAFPIVGDQRVEIRVTSTTFDTKHKIWERDRFVKLLKTLATKPSGPPDLAADHGLPALAVPAELASFRKQAAEQGKAASGWIRDQCAARTEDWIPQFVLGEYGERDGLARACQLLSAKPELTPPERNARLLAERVLGGQLVKAGEVKEAIAHLELANELAVTTKLAREARAPILFDLACCRARSGQPEDALTLLREAIKLDQSLRDTARTDPAFEALKDDKGFKGLVNS